MRLVYGQRDKLSENIVKNANVCYQQSLIVYENLITLTVLHAHKLEYQTYWSLPLFCFCFFVFYVCVVTVPLNELQNILHLAEIIIVKMQYESPRLNMICIFLRNF